jgi:hypothetical protein
VKFLTWLAFTLFNFFVSKRRWLGSESISSSSSSSCQRNTDENKPAEKVLIKSAA